MIPVCSGIICNFFTYICTLQTQLDFTFAAFTSNSMKFLITIAFLLLGAMNIQVAQAQTKLPPRKSVSPKPRTVIKGLTMRDGVEIKDGRLMITQQGLTNPLTQEMMLANGTTINTNGAVTMLDGTTKVLQAGDRLSLSGRLTTAAMLAEQDSVITAVKLQTQAQTKKKKLRY